MEGEREEKKESKRDCIKGRQQGWEVVIEMERERERERLYSL